MFGLKTYLKNNIVYPKIFFPKNTDKFPDKPVSQIRIKARLWGMLNKVKEQKKYAGLGNLITYPHQVAINVWNMFLPYNPNNLGNWSIKGIEPNQESTAIERELIWQMTDLYHGDKEKLEGYVTSGGTEANIFSAWLGRKHLQSKRIKKDQICLIKTSLTHYSIEKAADLVGVPVFITPLNEKTWKMDLDGFEKIIVELKNKGYQGFMVSLTLGYTVTGTIDPYEQICLETRKLKKKYGIEFFVWIDAALNGLIEPFLNSKFRPFDYPEIQTLLTDFHKFGLGPIPAGLILYRKDLRKLVEKPIDYLVQKDNTLLGSRNGIVPVACWGIIMSIGKRGYRKIIDDCLRRKNNFIKKIKNLDQSVQIVTSSRSLNLGLVFKTETNKKLQKLIEKKYGLFAGKMRINFSEGEKEMIIAKVFFLPNF